MARPRSAGYEDQRELILKQAAALFARQGYAATSMNQVAASCGVTKAAVYHYVRDKNELLALVAEAHVLRLEAVVNEVRALALEPQAQLRELILRFVREYAEAQNEHRVLTEDVALLAEEDRARVLGVQRRVVAAFSAAVASARPELGERQLEKPMAMLLFGMINWMFTWFRPGEPLTHEQLAPLVADLFVGGLQAVARTAESIPPGGLPRAASTPSLSNKETSA